MTQEQILEGNKVIADFIGWGYTDLEGFGLDFNRDWNYLSIAVRLYRDSVQTADVHSIRVYDAWHGMIISQIFEALVNAIKARDI